MIHDPLCPYRVLDWKVFCSDCERLVKARREGYRDGYNDSKDARTLGYELYGLPKSNQHGEGENP